MGKLGKELRKATIQAKLRLQRKTHTLEYSLNNKYGKGHAILMHPTRQMILEYLCKYPCSYLSAISKYLNISPVTASWHLKKMVSANILSVKKQGGTTIFFPKGMIRYEDIKKIALINTPSIKDIFSQIINNPGITQKELASLSNTVYQTIISHTKRLEKAHLIYSVKDGIYKRYYPTKTIKELEKYYKGIARRFENQLIEKLKKDGVNPKIISKRKWRGKIQISSGISTEELKVFFAPIFPTKLEFEEIK